MLEFLIKYNIMKNLTRLLKTITVLFSFSLSYNVTTCCAQEIDEAPPRDSEQEKYVTERNFYIDRPGPLKHVEDRIGERGNLVENNAFNSNIKSLAENLAVDAEVLFDGKTSGATVETKVLDDQVILNGIVSSQEEREVLGEKIAVDTGLSVVNKTEVGDSSNFYTLANSFASDVLYSILFLFLVFILIAIIAITFRKSSSAKKGRETAE